MALQVKNKVGSAQTKIRTVDHDQSFFQLHQAIESCLVYYRLMVEVLALKL